VRESKEASSIGSAAPPTRQRRYDEAQSIGERVTREELIPKKPPHYSVKFEKQPYFSEIAKNHWYCVGCLQFPLIVLISNVNAISDKQDPVRLMWHGENLKVHVLFAKRTSI
jgi:hypothetical protein